MKKVKDKQGQGEATKSSGIKFSPYLMQADSVLHGGEEKALHERLDRKHIRSGSLSGEGFVEIDLVGCDALELVEGSEHEVMLHHGWDRVKPDLAGSVNKDDNRIGERYLASDVRVWIRQDSFFGRKEMERASPLDFSVSGVGLVCGKAFNLNKRILLKFQFKDETAFELKRVVVRNDRAQLAASGSFSGIRLIDPDQLYMDHVLEEGLRRKLR